MNHFRPTITGLSMLGPCALVPRQPAATQLEQAASNLADEFGADFVLANKRFALAVYDEMLAAAPVNSAMTRAMIDVAYEAAKTAMPHEALIEIAPGELERVVTAVLTAALAKAVQS